MASLNATQQAFVDRYAPYANLASQQLGLPSRVILAKLAVETGYGQHFANNNLPGLKTGNSAQNDGFGSAQTATWEDYGGSGRTNIKDGFIRYPTPEQSIGGLVPWLTNSTYMNSLADRQGGGIFDRDAAAEASAVQALGSSGFSTDRNASAKVTDVLGRLPDLSSYGVAPSFTPAINQLMNYVPYNGAGQPNVSDGLGGFTNNDYSSGIRFQPGGGVVLPRERGGSGIQLPSPVMGPRQDPPGLLDTLANGADAVGRGLNNLFGGGSADASTPLPPILPAEGTDGFGNPVYGGPGDALGYGNSSFGQGITPFGDVSSLAFAGGRNFAGDAGLGIFGSGVSQPAPTDYAFSGANMGGGVAPSSAGQLPAGFDASAYLRANPDVAAAGADPRQHYLSFGMQEGRSLGAPGLTPTQGPSGSTSTLGPFDTASTLGNPFSTPTLGSGSTASTIGASPGFDAASYLAANADIRALGFTPDQAVQHYRDYGQFEVRPLAPGQEARVHAAPGGSSTFGPGTTAPTFGPDGSVNVMSTGLTPTLGPNGLASIIGPGGTVPSFSPGGDTSYLTMPSTTATTFGPPDASSGLPAGFDPVSYVNANPDLRVLGFNGQQATDHFRNFGQFEARPLAPGMEARVYAPPGLTPTQGPTNTASTIGPGSLTPTFGAPDLTSTIGPPALTGTYGPPATTPTIGAGSTVPSWSPFGGAGIGNPFGFSGANVGGGLGAGPQSFGSLWPVGSGGGEPAPAADPGSAGLGPFDFTNANVGGFDVNALGGGGGGTSGPNGVNDMGISGGFDSEGAMRRVLEQQAADIRRADQAAKTPMHSDPNAFNVAIANGGNTVGMGTALQTPGAIGGPVVPNVTVRNYATSAPGAMFSMFAPWR